MIKRNLAPSEYLVTSTSPLRISVALSKVCALDVHVGENPSHYVPVEFL